MKNEKLYDAISDIREEFIEEAENYKFKKSIGPRLVKWGAMAACFCLVVLGTSLTMGGAFAKKSDGTVIDGSNGSNRPTATPAPGEFPVSSGLLTVLAYNGALYNVSNELNTLNVAGIPDIMTSEDCGLSLGNLAKTEYGYEATTENTDMELYQYASAFSNTAVFVVRDGDEYMAGLFSNNLPLDGSSDHSTVSELYVRYGIHSAEQISGVQLYSGRWNNNLPVGPEEYSITERAALDAFYEATLSMETESYSKEEYLSILLEEDPMALASSTLTPAKTICITTAEGLKFYLNWAEEDGWIFSSGATAYYKITEEMQTWLDTYFP